MIFRNENQVFELRIEANSYDPRSFQRYLSKSSEKVGLIAHFHNWCSPRIALDCAIITWRGLGAWKSESGAKEKMTTRKKEGHLNVKFNTYSRGIFFFFPFCKLEK